MTARRWRVGVDIGGTFTDVTALDPTSHATVTAKVRTRVGDPLASLRAALAALDLGWEDVASLVHGTTLVTNAIVEDRLPAVALVATAGFADVLAIGRQNRRSLYSLSLPPKLPPLVPEPLRFELKERMGPDGKVKTPLEPADIEPIVEAIRRSGASSVAVSLLHAYANPAHERMVGDRLAAAVPHVSLSHRVNPEEREYERTSATVLNAAAMPLVGSYLDELGREVPKATQFHLFHSAGGMASTTMVRERPLVLALSGPAAGVSAARQVARELALDNVLTLDMGGTTTDVCLMRHGKPERRREANLADRPVRQTMLAVQSIGAGGGSIAYVEAGMLRVGPQSAGASPGPVCYGLGGTQPTVTDANLMLGYLDAAKPLADGVRLDLGLAQAAIARLADRLGLGPIETALGIVRVANANMVRAIRNVTVDRGIDGRRCTLVAFGGAGPLHAATLARDFGIRTVVVPAYSSAYSALGCAVANLSYTQQRTVRMASSAWSHERLARLRHELLADMKFDNGDRARGVVVEDTALVRYIGQSYSVEVPYRFPPDVAGLTRDFQAVHKQLYGFSTEENWELEAIRVTTSVSAPPLKAQPPRLSEGANVAPRATTPCWFSAERAIETPRYRRDALARDTHLCGPAIVEDEWSTITLPPGTALEATASAHLVLRFRGRAMTRAIDPVTLEVIRSALTAAAEEMSLVVMRSARSPLLREAGDLSSALTDAKGEMIAQGRDIPMHLGVMCFTVKEFLKWVPVGTLASGDVWFVNLPEIGGNHLPDVKAIRPIFAAGELFAFAVSLAHWADIGGAVPGSYFASATDIWQEGLRISPTRLFTADGPDREKLRLVLSNVRGALEREGDINAQMAATLVAERRLGELAAEHGLGVVKAAMAELQDRSEQQMREAIRAMPRGVFEGEDFLDDDGIRDRPIAVRVRLTFGDGEASFDFTTSDDAAEGPVNTTPFIAAAGVFYAMKCLAGEEIQPNGGALRPLTVKTRPGSVLEPPPTRPVVGGNHETSQRVVDAIFRALEPAMAERLSAGGPTTSGLLLFGMRRADGTWATLYETHGGGEGARVDRDGASVVRVHMSNVMNTPAEVIEAEYPIEVVRQTLRRGSGGAGAHRGGAGLLREYRMLTGDVSLTSMFERRVIPPYGLQGGAPGARFRVNLVTAEGKRREVKGKANLRLSEGDRIILESCGGGGYGRPKASRKRRKVT